MPRVSLQTRLLASTLSALVVVLGAGYLWFRHNLFLVLEDRMDRLLRDKVHEIGDVAARDRSFEALQEELEREIKVYREERMLVAVDFSNGKSIIAPHDEETVRSAARFRQMSIGSEPADFAVEGAEYRVISADLPGGRMLVGLSLDPAKETLRDFDRRSAMGVAFLTLLAAPLGVWLQRQALRPVHLAVRSARRIDPGDLSARLPTTGVHDELDQLAGAFNQLLDRLEFHQKRVNRFTADAAHELRTPLAAMRAAVEVALNQPRTNEHYVALLESLGAHGDRLTQIVDALQLLARGDAGGLPIVREKVDLIRLVQQQIELFTPLAEDKNITLSLVGDNSVSAFIDPARIRQVVVNLLDNAVKFTPSGGSVFCRCERHPMNCLLQVEDTGGGVLDADLPFLFDRFYRAAESKTKAGSGLGLSICKTIVDAHGGTISAARGAGGTTIFKVILPHDAKGDALDRRPSGSAPRGIG